MAWSPEAYVGDTLHRVLYDYRSTVFYPKPTSSSTVSFWTCCTVSKKQPNAGLYKTALEQFEVQLERARALELEQAEKQAKEMTELTSGLASQAEEDWKKKQSYD